jgi:hypothetical protein
MLPNSYQNQWEKMSDEWLCCWLLVIQRMVPEASVSCGQSSITENIFILNLTFVGLCIAIYFCSKTNQINNILNLFYFGTTLYMFRTVFPSIIRSLRRYIQHHTMQVVWLLASGTISVPLASSHRTCMTYTWCCMYCLRFLMMDGKTETCRVLFQNKVNLRYCASGWFYLRNSS